MLPWWHEWNWMDPASDALPAHIRCSWCSWSDYEDIVFHPKTVATAIEGLRGITAIEVLHPEGDVTVLIREEEGEAKR